MSGKKVHDIDTMLTQKHGWDGGEQGEAGANLSRVRPYQKDNHFRH